MIENILIRANDSTPIFQQVEGQIQRFIRSGLLKPGEELPSVRAIAAQIAVNPMTVSKAITRLVEAGWLEHQRGKATRVAMTVPDHANKQPDSILQNDAERLVSHAKQLGLSNSDLTQLITTIWKE